MLPKKSAILVATMALFASPSFAQSTNTEYCDPDAPDFYLHADECLALLRRNGSGSGNSGNLSNPSEGGSEPASLCNSEISLALSGGEYTLKVGLLQLLLNGNVIMHPDPASEGSLTAVTSPTTPPELVLTGLPVGMPSDIRLHPVVPDGTDVWDFLAAPVLGVDFEALNTEQSCSLSALPDLEGSFQTRSQDGFDIAHTWRMVALGQRHFAGIWTFSAIGTPHPAVGTRTIEMVIE